MAALVFELQITVMLYLDFQRGTMLYNFHVCAAFLKTVGMPQCQALDPSLDSNDTDRQHECFRAASRALLFYKILHVAAI